MSILDTVKRKLSLYLPFKIPAGTGISVDTPTLTVTGEKPPMKGQLSTIPGEYFMEISRIPPNGEEIELHWVKSIETGEVFCINTSLFHQLFKRV